MKKIFVLLLALLLVFSFASCGTDEPADDPVQQEQQQPDEQQENEGSEEAEQQDNSQQEQQTPNDTQSDEGQSDENIPTSGKPLDWPENDYTALVPIPDEGGKVLAAGGRPPDDRQS